MARLIIVSGASGAGKTFLLESLQECERSVTPLKKLTTRPPRSTEPQECSLDLCFNCSREEVIKCDYTYRYCGHVYGVRKSDIDAVLRSDQCPVVIVASCSTIERIKRDYKDALVLYVQNVLSGEDLKRELIKRRDPIEVEERMRRQNYSLNDYVANVHKKLFNYVLINDFTQSLIVQMQYIIDNEIHRGADSNLIFVIMSFDNKYNDVYRAYQLAADRYKQRRHLTVKRVDEDNGDYIITMKIEDYIKRAGLILCDISALSPNVFYEFGFARALAKDIIITAKVGTPLPFDVQQYRTVFYNSEIDLQDKISSELSSHYSINL
jgi:guanylate kinase